MTDFIVSPGQTGTLNDTSPPEITLSVAGKTGDLIVDGLREVSMPMAKDTYTWTQMNYKGKRQIPTTASNSVTTTIVLDKEQFFGNAAATPGSASNLGIFGLQDGGVKISWNLNIGAEVLSGVGYVTGVTPTVSPDEPVWTSPITITVDGDITHA